MLKWCYWSSSYTSILSNILIETRLSPFGTHLGFNPFTGFKSPVLKGCQVWALWLSNWWLPGTLSKTALVLPKGTAPQFPQRQQSLPLWTEKTWTLTVWKKVSIMKQLKTSWNTDRGCWAYKKYCLLLCMFLYHCPYINVLWLYIQYVWRILHETLVKTN